MASPSGVTWSAACYLGDNQIPITHIERFEWKSMVNGGYIIRVRAADPNFNILDSVVEGSGALLEAGRQVDKLILIRFQLQWLTSPDPIKTKTYIALMSDLYARSHDDIMNGSFEFIAVDPISYYVNSGDCSGAAYRGKVGGDDGVIAQVLKDYIPDSIGGYDVDIKVAKTTDSENTYWMMRQDPKTFIMSLLDWSSSFTEHKTSWVVSNGFKDNVIQINVSESYTPSLQYPEGIEGDQGDFILTAGVGETPNIMKWELLADNFISAMNLKILTSGMSAVSGEYLDRIVDDKEEKVYVTDDNTENKQNPKLTKEQSFTKPKSEKGATPGTGERSAKKRGWTHLHSVPEIYSANDVGEKYDKYIDGRARQNYIEMLNMLLRMRVTVRGQPRLTESDDLCKTKVTMRWHKIDNENGGYKARFIDGDWMLYGWHHILVRDTGMWTTDVYLSRLDYNAKSIGKL
jgi:hypothetical protein